MGANDEWSGEEKDRKSTTGYYAKLSGNFAALVWGVGMQATVFFQPQNQGTSAEFQGRCNLAETNSVELQYPTEISNNDCIGQPELYQTMPKPNYAQEEQKH